MFNAHSHHAWEKGNLPQWKYSKKFANIVRQICEPIVLFYVQALKLGRLIECDPRIAS